MFVPVKVHSATKDRTVHFHEVHVDDGARIEHKRICPKEDKEVPYKEIVKGYEVSEGKYVVLEDDELKAAAGPASRVVVERRATTYANTRKPHICPMKGGSQSARTDGHPPAHPVKDSGRGPIAVGP